MNILNGLECNKLLKDRSNLDTEKANQRSESLDTLDVNQLVHLFSEEDLIPQKAVADALAEIESSIELITSRLSSGGRLFYLGTGTSGRLGVLDASECPPTFCTNPDMVQGVIAGGIQSLIKSSESLEDDDSQSVKDLLSRGFNSKDVLVGISAGGTTPYVISALRYSLKIKASAISISCVPRDQVQIPCDLDIRLITGPELITGSTRLKAGTATKLALNMISTIVMIRMGKVYKNNMVDLSVSNEKLLDRGVRIFTDITGLDRDNALHYLRLGKGSVKIAVIMAIKKLDFDQASILLKSKDDNLRSVLK